jgi:hypothetical protein
VSDIVSRPTGNPPGCRGGRAANRLRLLNVWVPRLRPREMEKRKGKKFIYYIYIYKKKSSYIPMLGKSLTESLITTPTFTATRPTSPTPLFFPQRMARPRTYTLKTNSRVPRSLGPPLFSNEGATEGVEDHICTLLTPSQLLSRTQPTLQVAVLPHLFIIICRSKNVTLNLKHVLILSCVG